MSIVSIGYDPEQHRLLVELQDGQLVQYSNISDALAEQLVHADDPAAFVCDQIRGRFAHIMLPRGYSWSLHGALSDADRDAIDHVHRLFYARAQDVHIGNAAQSGAPIFWRGHRCQKCPLDLWVYQEILHEVRPTLIIECGTAAGGTTLFLADMLDTLGIDGSVLGIELIPAIGRPMHPRIAYLDGDTLSSSILKQVEALASEQRVMVILDDDHSCEHVHREIEQYGRWVSPGSYLIVEDTNINGHPVAPDFGPGPWEAVERYMAEQPQAFTVDVGREKFLLTMNPRGYLRKNSP